MRTVHDLLHDYQHVIEDVTIVTGSKGVFEVEVDGEVLERFRALLGPAVPPYER